jgi:hypothetical protein
MNKNVDQFMLMDHQPIFIYIYERERLHAITIQVNEVRLWFKCFYLIAKMLFVGNMIKYMSYRDYVG